MYANCYEGAQHALRHNEELELADGHLAMGNKEEAQHHFDNAKALREELLLQT